MTRKCKKILLIILASALMFCPLARTSALGPFTSEAFTALPIPQQFDAIYFYTNFLKVTKHRGYETSHITLSQNTEIEIENLLQWKIVLLEYIRNLESTIKLDFFYCVYKMLSPNSTLFERIPTNIVRSFRMELITDAVDSYGSPGILRIMILTPITRETIII